MTMVDERPKGKCPMCNHTAHGTSGCGSKFAFMVNTVPCPCDYNSGSEDESGADTD